MRKRKLLFIDRDGTLIKEPDDHQIDRMDKLAFMPDVVPSLLRLKKAGHAFVMISNQDGLGSLSLPTKEFIVPHEFMLQVFESQGIFFEAVRICPHLPQDNCECRKPKLGLIMDYITGQEIDRDRSYIIGDRETDLQLAKNMGINGLRIGEQNTRNWKELANTILFQSRSAFVTRKTNETSITVNVNLDHEDKTCIDTGIDFFNHMLEQLAKHGGFSLSLQVKGDLNIDDHHTVEDTAITLGKAIREALGDKIGINRYGFLLPMDEARALVALDLSGRSYFVFKGKFDRESVGGLSTELVPHFFRSFSEGLKATLHIDIKGENTHHMIESIFKSVGRSLRQAIEKGGTSLPSTKGAL